MAESIALNVTTTTIHYHAYEGADDTSRVRCRKCGDEATIEELLPLGMLHATAADIMRDAPPGEADPY